MPLADVLPIATQIADGLRFLAIVPEQAGTGSLTIVQNWRAALERKR